MEEDRKKVDDIQRKLSNIQKEMVRYLTCLYIVYPKLTQLIRERIKIFFNLAYSYGKDDRYLDEVQNKTLIIQTFIEAKKRSHEIRAKYHNELSGKDIISIYDEMFSWAK